MIRSGIFFFFISALLLAPSHADDRIVAVGGSITEIVFALGEEHRLIARDSTSSWPEAAQSLPDVGYMRALSPEGILSVDPSHILLLEGSGPPETLDLLGKSGVPMTVIPEGFTAEGLARKVLAVGKALGAEQKAAALADEIEADLAATRSAVASGGHDARVMFILSTANGRVLASGLGTAADGILQLAGARNAVTAFQGYKQLNDEAILKAAPEIILMMERGGSLDDRREQVLAHPAIGQTPAGLNGRLITMNGLYLLGFGPRTAQAVRDLSAQIAAFNVHKAKADD